MITYHSPETFCWCVCNDASERGWKVRKEPCMSGFTLTLGGINRTVNFNPFARSMAYCDNRVDEQNKREALTAFIDLCREYAEKYKLGIKYKALTEEEIKERAAFKEKRRSEHEAKRRLNEDLKSGGLYGFRVHRVIHDEVIFEETVKQMKEAFYKSFGFRFAEGGTTSDSGPTMEEQFRQEEARMHRAKADAEMAEEAYRKIFDEPWRSGNPRYHGMKHTFHKKY